MRNTVLIVKSDGKRMHVRFDNMAARIMMVIDMTFFSISIAAEISPYLLTHFTEYNPPPVLGVLYL
jgi:hypothetical protein